MGTDLCSRPLECLGWLTGSRAFCSEVRRCGSRYFIMLSIWQHRFYYLFGFLVLVFIILVVA